MATIDKRLALKGASEPRAGLVEQGNYHVALAEGKAAKLAEHGWDAAQTQEIAAKVALLEEAREEQVGVHQGKSTATLTEGQARRACKAFIRKLRQAMPIVLRQNPDSGVSASDFNAGQRIGNNTALIVDYLTKIRRSVETLEAGFSKLLAQPAVAYLDKVRGDLKAADAVQEHLVGTAPEATQAVYEAKGRLLELIEDCNRIGKIAFDGDTTVRAQFNKDILQRARKQRKGDKPPSGS